MRRFLLVFFAGLLIAAGTPAPRGVMASGSGARQVASAAKPCKKGYKRVNGLCKKQPATTKTFKLKAVQVAGFTAVDAQGNIYADSGTTSVVKFSPAGKVLAQWDGLHADGDRPDPAGGIAIDGQGNVFVVDTDANRIVKLSLSLHALAQWGGYGIAPGQFIQPEGIAVDAQGNIYVADTGNSRIQKLSPDGSASNVWDNGNDLRNPVAVAVDQHGAVYVVDVGYNRVVKLSPSGQRLAVWTNLGSTSNYYGVDLTVGKAGNVYVADPGDTEILKLSPSGSELDSWSSDALSGYTFVGVTLSPQGTVYASECPNSNLPPAYCRTVKLSSGGQTLTVWQSGANPIAPGTKVDIGGYGLYLRCLGQGSPTVIFESGYGFTSGEWSYLQPQVAGQTRVCAYDRAGIGYSDARPNSTNASGLQTVKELHTLLQKANIPGPYVLAGHSFGGIFIRLFTESYRSEIAGMVLIDSSHEDQCVALNDSTCGAGSGEIPDGFATTFQQLDAATGGVVKGSLRDLPLVVLTQNVRLPACLDCMGNGANGQVWANFQRDLASASSNSIHVVAMRSGHLIPFEQPGLVIEAVRQVIDTARSTSHVLSPCGAAFQQLGGQCMS
ncbi:MAG TPA: alpha/beta fold hydrolase [Chloroflexota bacterium]